MIFLFGVSQHLCNNASKIQILVIIILKKQSPYVKNQVTSLNNCLASIETLSVPVSINHHIQPYNSNPENGATMLIDNPAEFSQNNFEGDDELNGVLIGLYLLRRYYW
jgi:hypothetical protein